MVFSVCSSIGVDLFYTYRVVFEKEDNFVFQLFILPSHRPDAPRYPDRSGLVVARVVSVSVVVRFCRHRYSCSHDLYA